MPSLINNCINIENNIQDINSLKENLNKTMLMNTIMQFISDEEELLFNTIKNYGNIYKNDNEKYNYIIKNCQNYEVSNNGKIVTKKRKSWFYLHNFSILPQKWIGKILPKKLISKINKFKLYF